MGEWRNSSKREWPRSISQCRRGRCVEAHGTYFSSNSPLLIFLCLMALMGFIVVTHFFLFEQAVTVVVTNQLLHLYTLVCCGVVAVS